MGFSFSFARDFDVLPQGAQHVGQRSPRPVAVDLDLDGLLDIYVANGFISGTDLKDT